MPRALFPRQKLAQLHLVELIEVVFLATVAITLFVVAPLFIAANVATSDSQQRTKMDSSATHHVAQA